MTSLASNASLAVTIKLAITGRLLHVLTAACMDIANHGRRERQSEHWLADPCTYSTL